MDLTLREKTGGRRLVALLAAIMAAVALAFACLPVTAEALTVSNATARPNEDGGSSVIGGIATRLTWEATVDDGEEVSSITLQLPDDGTFNGSSTKVTVLEGLKRISTDATAMPSGNTIKIDFAEPVASGSLLRLEIEDMKFPTEGGDVQVTGTYTNDAGEQRLAASPAITTIANTPLQAAVNWLDNQAWVQAWNSVPFLNMFLKPQIMLESFSSLFSGWLVCLTIVILCYPFAIVLGLLFAFMKISKHTAVRAIAVVYINILRGTPLFLQIYIAFFGLPLAGIQIPTFPLGVIVLAMNSSAYLCEIFRAGIQSISKGQFEAARSLGMNGAQTMLYVIIPQTVRRVIPTMTSEFILLYKDTSMLAAVGTMEIVMNAKTIVASTGSITPYVVAACFYLIITLPLAKVVGNLESRLASNDTGKGGKKKRKSKKHAIGTGDAAGALGSGAGTAAAEARATGDAVAAKRPDAVEGTGITPEQMSSL